MSSISPRCYSNYFLCCCEDVESIRENTVYHSLKMRIPNEAIRDFSYADNIEY